MAPLTSIEKHRLRRYRRDIRKKRKQWWIQYWKTVVVGSITGLVCVVVFSAVVYSRYRDTKPKLPAERTSVQWAATAMAAFQGGDGAAAIEAMENVSESDSPYRFAANRWLAELLVTGQMHRQDPLAAHAIANHMQRSIRDEDVDALVATGLIAFALGDQEAAISHWSKATLQKPPRNDVLLPLAWSLAWMDRSSEANRVLSRAEAHYQKVAAVSSVDHWIDLGWIETLIALGKTDAAEMVHATTRERLVNQEGVDESTFAQLDHALARITMQRIATTAVDETVQTFQRIVPRIPDCVAVWRAWFRLRSVHGRELTAAQLAWASQYSTRPAYRIAASQVVLDRDVKVDEKSIWLLADVYGNYLADHPNDPNAIHMLCRTVLRASGLPEILMGDPGIDLDGLNRLPEEPLEELTDGTITSSVTDTLLSLVTANQAREDYRQTLAFSLARDEQFGMAIPLLQTASFLDPDDRWVHEILALCQEVTGKSKATEQTRRYIRESCDERIVLMPSADPSQGVRMINLTRQLFWNLQVTPPISLESWIDPQRPGQLGSDRLDRKFLRLIYEPAWSPSSDAADDHESGE